MQELHVCAPHWGCICLSLSCPEYAAKVELCYFLVLVWVVDDFCSDLKDAFPRPDRAIAGRAAAPYDNARRGALEDLEDAARFDEDALRLRPPGHPTRTAALLGLSTDLSTRFLKRNVSDDLARAIELQHEAVRLNPTDFPIAQGLAALLARGELARTAKVAPGRGGGVLELEGGEGEVEVLLALERGRGVGRRGGGGGAGLGALLQGSMVS